MMCYKKFIMAAKRACKFAKLFLLNIEGHFSYFIAYNNALQQLASNNI